MSRSQHQRKPKDPKARTRRKGVALEYRLTNEQTYARFYWMSPDGALWPDPVVGELHRINDTAWLKGIISVQDVTRDDHGRSTCQLHGPPSVALRLLRNQITRLVRSRPVSARAFAERNYP